MYTTSCLSIYQLIDRYLGCIHTLAIGNSASLNICVQVFVWISEFNYSEYIFRSRNAGSYDDSMFYLLRNCRIVFHSSWTIWHPHQQCMKVNISIHPYQHLFWFFYYYYSYPIGCKVMYHLYLIFLVTNNIEHFACAFGNFYNFFGKVFIEFSCPYFNRVVCLFVGRLYVFFMYLCIFSTKHPDHIRFANIFYQFVSCLWLSGILCTKALNFD